MARCYLFAFAFILFTQTSTAQTVALTPAPAQATAPKLTAEQGAQLAEASRLSVSVVKLYGERKYDEALPLAERAVAIRKQVLGPVHPLVASALINLASVNGGKGRAGQAQEDYEQALKIYEKILAPDELKISSVLESLGVIARFATSDFGMAIDYYQRSLAIKEKKLGATHKDLIPTLYTLAELYELHNENGAAIQTYQRVVNITEQQMASEPYNLIRPLERYACLTERLHQKDETKKIEERLEAIRQQLEAERAGDDTKPIIGGVINGKAISKPAPAYPEEARALRVSGIVKVWIIVDETGGVIDAAPCGHPLLADAAVRAAYTARFTPTLLNGKPVKVSGFITYNFVLR